MDFVRLTKQQQQQQQNTLFEKYLNSFSQFPIFFRCLLPLRFLTPYSYSI